MRQTTVASGRLAVISPPLTLDDLANPTRMSAKLAAQRPAWKPGTRHGYHAITIGWYVGELIRRTDPAARSLGQFFADDVAKPLGLDFYIGLPASVDRSRLAYIHGMSIPKMVLHLNTMPPLLALSALNPRSLSARSFAVPGFGSNAEELNSEAARTVEMPGFNGMGNARAVAKLYGSVAIGGSELGMTAPTLDALMRPATPPTDGLRDKVLHVDTVFSLGFVKAFPEVDIRFLGEGVWNGGNRRIVRVRRPGYRYRVRLRDEQNGLPPLERSTRTRPSPITVPRHSRHPHPDLIRVHVAQGEGNGVLERDDIRESQNFVSEMARRYDGHHRAAVKRY